MLSRDDRGRRALLSARGQTDAPRGAAALALAPDLFGDAHDVFAEDGAHFEAATRLHRNKLATALANKLARIAWSVLANVNDFDANQGKIAAS